MNPPLPFYLLSFLAALLGSGLSLRGWRGWCLRHRLVDDPGPRKIHSEPTPLAGGLAVLTGLALALLAMVLLQSGGFTGAGLSQEFRSGVDGLGGGWLAILAGAVGMMAIGWLDDRHELRPAPKFLAQLLVAAWVSASGVRITLFVPSLLFSHLITILWILTVTNAVNFQDNMNGLCAGLAVLAATGLGLLAARQGQHLVAGVAFMTAGAAAGFLPHNFPRARAFLGDSGSHLLGFLLAVLAILPHFYSPQHLRKAAVLSPLLLLAVPLADLVWVVWFRLRSGRPFYLGDTSHFSHRLERRGLSRAAVVVVLWILAALGGFAALLL